MLNKEEQKKVLESQRKESISEDDLEDLNEEKEEAEI